jgi:hypothetical protein
MPGNLTTSLSLLVCLHVLQITHSFQFAFYDNKLYVNLEDQVSDRGYQTVWGLLQLQLYAIREGKALPNILLTLDNIRNDQLEGKQLAFWRREGDPKIDLWPEHDYWGWQSSWQAPYPIYAQAMEKEALAVPWDRRRHAVYWSGDVEMNQMRKAYADCAAENKRIVFQGVDWQVFQKKPNWRDAEGKILKPMFLDSRKRAEYKYNIYLYGLQWSSSFKRLLPSGAAIIIPSPNPHETLVTMLLKQHCADCYISLPYINSSSFCSHLKHLMHNSSIEADSSAKKMARRIMSFANKHLNLNATLEYMHQTLHKIASRQATQSNHGLIKDIEKLGLEEYDCAKIHQKHLNPALRPEDNSTRWQYYLWYDDRCEMVTDSLYLDHTAI